MEGPSDKDEGVEDGDDIEDVGVLPPGRGHGHSPRSKKFILRWHTTRP